MYYFEQSAGNQKISNYSKNYRKLTVFEDYGENNFILVGSSETIRNPHNFFIVRKYSPLNNKFKNKLGKASKAEQNLLGYVGSIGSLYYLRRETVGIRVIRFYSTNKSPIVINKIDKVDADSLPPSNSLIETDNIKKINPLIKYINFKEDRLKIFIDYRYKN